MNPYEKDQLCCFCANAVPSADGKRGCSWSRELAPVEGWTAEVTNVPTYYKKTNHAGYHIIDCPEFVADSEVKLDPNMMTDEAARLLCIAIVKEAVNDWYKLCKKSKSEQSEPNFEELRSFFITSCGAVGRKILERLEKHRSDETKQAVEK